MSASKQLPHTAPTVRLREAFWVWFRIGWLGFGGPAGQIALMHQELVEKRGWISESRFLHALSFCMLLPGPEAQQLSVYIGWLMHRGLGGLIAGVLFVLPGALVLFALSALYLAYGHTTTLSSMFFGLKAAVLALVLEAVKRIAGRALRHAMHRWLAVLAFIAISFLALPFPWVVLLAGVLGILIQRWRPAWLPALQAEPGDSTSASASGPLPADGVRPGVSMWRRTLGISALCLSLWALPLLALSSALGTEHTLVKEGLFFSQTAVVTFGGAYAVLAYVAQQAVTELGWLKPTEMVNGLALAETTPGPLILVLQFVGFVAAFRHPGGLDPWLAASLGALITTWVTFLPSFWFVLVGAPFVERLRQHQPTQAALSCIMAAVVGVVLNLALWFGLHTLFREHQVWEGGIVRVELPIWASVDLWALTFALIAMLAVFRFKQSLVRILIGSALLGLLHGWVLR